MNAELIKKYDVPVPRYTSYPPVPFWNQTPSEHQWYQSLKDAVTKPRSTLSIYVHLPYCETLCHFCGCTKIITKDHSKSIDYIRLVLHELDLYIRNVPEIQKSPLVQLHLGGGSPTFFKADELSIISSKILERFELHSNFEASIEVDPRRLQHEQLAAVKKSGFNRISLGVQDFNSDVQRTVNRIQPYELTRQAVEWSRELGFKSINFDLIYGLPKQTLHSFYETIVKVCELRPERIALYSLAMVPWMKPSQRLFKPEDLPNPELKRSLYEQARTQLLKAGYIEIGMDHFALPEDELSIAFNENRLNRNFMGYTDNNTDVLLGLGLSSISETPNCFHQNSKDLEGYTASILNNQLATERGHLLSATEVLRKKQILELMTKYESEMQTSDTQETELKLLQLMNDGIVKIKEGKISITELGKPFVRNVCAALDEHMTESKTDSPRFSKSI